MGAKALAGNPCDGVKLPRSAKAEMHFLSEDEVEKLATAITYPEKHPSGHGAAPLGRAEFPEYGLLVQFAAYTGLARANSERCGPAGLICFVAESR